jgi:hypothetical protein
MTEFLVELYVSKTNGAVVGVEWERLNRAADELTGEGRPVRLLRSIFVPEDETCFVLVEAATAETVRETARRAALPCERVVEATVDLTNGGHLHGHDH